MPTNSEIIRKISQSRKYKSVYPKTIERVVAEIAGKNNPKDVEEKSRNILHQIWGSYWPTRPNFDKLNNQVAQELENGFSVQDILLRILRIQSSTNERLEILNEFYKQIFEVTGIPESIIEHACGLNPLTYFWMDLPKETKYTAFDIDIEEIEFLNSVFRKTKVADRAQAKLGDILTDEFEYADVVFMLKTLPVLQKQQKNSIRELIRKQKCKYLVVSFPTKSIGGREKGMLEFYSEQFESLLQNENLDFQKLIFKSELVYILKIFSNI